MANIFSLLVRLQGSARVLETQIVKGPNGEETRVWSLSDRTCIEIHAKSRIRNGEKEVIAEGAVKHDKSSREVIGAVKRKYARLNKQRELPLCM